MAEATSELLRTKNGLSYTIRLIRKSSDSRMLWLVHINGLALDQSFWQASITDLQARLDSKGPRIYSTTYDRIGQGSSALSDGAQPTKHDLMYAVQELQDLLEHIVTEHLGGVEKHQLTMIMLSHSIGVPLLRLFMSKHGREWPIAGTVLLDSNMANIDMVELLPDPTAADFDPSKLPADTDTESLEWSRSNIRRMFSPEAPNRENLDRSTLPRLLPFSDRPVFPESRNGKDMHLAVIAHDPKSFAEESLKICTLGLTDKYVEPAWHEYNLGLLRLTGRSEVSSSDILVASGSGHFVQRDNPGIVAIAVNEMIEKIVRN